MVEINVRNKTNYKGEGIYIGRPTVLSNPFRITEEQSRKIAIQRYGYSLISAIHKRKDPAVMQELRKLEALMYDQKQINLVCHCAPLMCHGDLIKQVLLNKYHQKYWLIKENCPTCGHGEYKIGIYGL